MRCRTFSSDSTYDVFGDIEIVFWELESEKRIFFRKSGAENSKGIVWCLTRSAEELRNVLDQAHRALVVTAIGAGSMFVAHVNDSLFWVVNGCTGEQNSEVKLAVCMQHAAPTCSSQRCDL
jgi:hypothetical protein